MNIVTFDRAVTEIVKARELGVENPFVFVVGAGISCPQVPLAEGIVLQCQASLGESEADTPPEHRSNLDRYSYWLGKANAQPKQRQQFFRNLIEGTSISLANLRLAHLLISGFGNIVITPNFDDFIERSLRLFGHTTFRICDRSELSDRIEPEERDIQIVHVHGTYQNYDLANLKGELKSAVGLPTPHSMLGLLAHVFRRRSPIVIGYSGWAGDVIMTALRNQLEDHSKKGYPLHFNIYWFCYDENALHSLQQREYKWLRQHNHVVFVKPPHEVDQVRLKDRDSTANRQDGIAKLPALMIFDAFVRAMGLKSPPIVADPFSFFANQLEQTLGPAAEAGSESRLDPYSFGSVIRRIRRARRREQLLEARRLKRRVQKAALSSLRSIRKAVSGSLYDVAKESAHQIPVDQLDLAELDDLKTLLSIIRIAIVKEEPGSWSIEDDQLYDRVLHRIKVEENVRQEELREFDDQLLNEEPEPPGRAG